MRSYTLSILKILLLFCASDLVAIESDQVVLYSDERETFVEFPQIQRCEVLNDDEGNFSIEKVPKMGFRVKANGAYKRQAMLLLVCPKAEKVFQLKFVNAPKNQLEDFNSVLKRPDSYFRFDALRAGNGLTNGGFLWHDHSLKVFKATAFRNYRDFDELDWYSTGINLSHQLTPKLAVGYGVNRSYFQQQEKQSHTGWINTYGANLFLQRTYNNEDEQQYNFTFVAPAPILLRYRHFLDFDLTLTRSFSRAFFLAYVSEFSQRIQLTYSLITNPAIDRREKVLEIDNRFFIQPAFGINLIHQTETRCRKKGECLMSLMTLSSRIRTKSIVGRPEYGMHPHFAAIDLAYRFKGNQEIGIYYKKPFEPLEIFKDKSWVESVGGVEESTFSTTVKLEYRHSQNFYSLSSNAPLYPEESRKELLLALNARHEGDVWEYGAGISGRPVSGELSDFGLNVFVKKYIDENLKSLSEAVLTHSISGIVKSDMDQNPIIGVQVSLQKIGSNANPVGKRRTTVTKRDGTYVFTDVEKQAEYEIAISYKGIIQKSIFYKERHDIQSKYDQILDDISVIDVEVYVDTNNNGRVDSSDRKVAVPLSDEMVGEDLIQVPGARIDNQSIIVDRTRPFTYKINGALIPSPYKVKAVLPRGLNTKKKKYHTLYILLEGP